MNFRAIMNNVFIYCLVEIMFDVAKKFGYNRVECDMKKTRHKGSLWA